MTTNPTSIHRGPTLRAVLYLRQSVSREESISLELQETAGRAYAKQQGYAVVAVESDPGISGRTWKRPAVLRVMAMIEEDRADVIVLWKWSRLSRSRLDWAVAADKVETAGGRIESATEPLDVSTSTGRLARGMLTEFAAFESERIGDVWKESHARRVNNGIPSTGKPKFGYSYTKATNFTPDQTLGPVLAQLYRRYNAGESFYALNKWLNENGIETVTGYGNTTDGRWTPRTLRRVMDSGFGAGYFVHQGERLKGIHQPVITSAEWDEYQVRRDSRRVRRKGEKSLYLLTGLLFCSVCGCGMYGGLSGTPKNLRYRCSGAQERQEHPGGYISEHVVVSGLLTWLAELSKEIDTAAKQTKPPAPPKTDPTPGLRRQRIKNEARLDNLTMKLIDGTIPQATYERTRNTLMAEQHDLDKRIRELKVEEQIPARTLVPSLLQNWDILPLPGKRDILSRLIARIEVTPGRPVGKFEIVARWDQ